MKKTLFSIAFLLPALFAISQSWNTGGNHVWVYDFGAGTGNQGTTFTGASVNSVSSATTQGFLPQPPSGNAKVAIGSTGAASFTLLNNGTSDTLRLNASSTANVGKVSFYDIEGATPLTAVFVTLNFEDNQATGGDFKLAVGYSTTAASMFNNTSGIGNSNTTSLPEVFGSLRWVISSTDPSKMIASFRNKATAGEATVFTDIPFEFNRGTSYNLELMCNNTASSQTYTRGSNSYTVSSRTYHVWANEVQLQSISGINEFPANQLAVGTAINAMLLHGVQSRGPAGTNTSALVYLNQNGVLAYTPFANRNETNAENVIPNFSFAGYKGGGVALPDLPVKKTISPIAGDNRLHIQNAINDVENMTPDANGFRGAVLLQPGLYEVNGTLTISKSGVVLRGAGQGSNSTSNTIIHATKPSQHTLIEVKGTGSGFTELSNTRRNITTAFVGTGAMSFAITSPAGYAVGDTIAVVRTPNDFWISDLAMGQYGWTAAEYAVDYERVITAINGNTITINAPVVDPIQTKYGGGHVFKASFPGRISNSGVENIRLTSYYAHDTDENHGWQAVVLRRAENCWVKQVTAQYFGYSCVSVGSQSSYNTIEECAMLDPKSVIDGGKRYSFDLTGGSFNLFQRCYARSGRHDFVTGSRVPGPNVFLDCAATDTKNQTGPHHRWATGTLFDNIYAGDIYVENRKASGTGHGWAGAQTLFWNCVSYKGTVEVNSPKGAMNWAIGTTGITQSGDGLFESWNTNVTPRSLYITQLKERLGQTAVDNVTTPVQRRGAIYGLLLAWAGEGKQPETGANTVAEIPDNSASVLMSKLFMQLGNSPLPVSLASFTGTLEDNEVKLKWHTASESNNARFDVLRFSADNNTPVKIGEVKGVGNSNSIVHYAFTDKAPLAGTNFYQLRQVDFDGRFVLSNVVAIKAGNAATGFRVYKTSANEFIAGIYSDVNTAAVLALVDVSGRTISWQNVQLTRGNNNISIQHKPLAPGVYVVKLLLNAHQFTEKIVVN